MPYNPSLANVFFRSGDIESWGRGYRRILRKNEAAGLLPPIVQTDDGMRVTHYVDVSEQVKAMGAELIIELGITNWLIIGSSLRQKTGGMILWGRKNCCFFVNKKNFWHENCEILSKKE